MIILYEILCLNFVIYNGVNVKQCNYVYNDDNMFVINPLYTLLIKSSFVLTNIRYYSNLKMMTTFVIIDKIIFTCRVCFCSVNNGDPSKNCKLISVIIIRVNYACM